MSLTPRLYDLGRAHTEALDLVQADMPEGVSPEEWAARQDRAWQQLERVEGAVEQKAGAIVHLLEVIDGEEAALEAWIASAKARRDQRRGVKARLRTLLGGYLDLAGEKTLRTLAGTVSRLAARSSVVVDDEEELPEHLVDAVVVLRPRMDALRVALEDAAERKGPPVPGAHLARGEKGVQVRHGAPKAARVVEAPKAVPTLPAPAGCPEHGPLAVETSPEGTAHCRVCEALARGAGPTTAPAQPAEVAEPPAKPKRQRKAKPPAESPSALAAVAAGPGAQALAEPLRALGADAVIAEPLAPAPYLAPGSRLVGAPCPRGCGAHAIPGKGGEPGPCETCVEAEVIDAQVAEDAAQAEREDAEERAAIRASDGLAPDGSGPGLPLGPGGARPW